MVSVWQHHIQAWNDGDLEHYVSQQKFQTPHHETTAQGSGPPAQADSAEPGSGQSAQAAPDTARRRLRGKQAPPPR
eukprot:15477784-Alexandrium_andersonii.AAC.1